MLDLLGILFSSIMMFLVILRAIQLTARNPGSGRRKPVSIALA